jgi:hypothetical protein
MMSGRINFKLMISQELPVWKAKVLCIYDTQMLFVQSIKGNQQLSVKTET